MWQNFLEDKNVVSYIIENIKDKKKLFNFDICLEIWPWKWAITKDLVNIFWRENFYLFEKDLTFSSYLKKIVPEENIFWWDILKKNLTKILKKISNRVFTHGKICVVWNIPYYITSPILKKFFVESDHIFYGTFMVQKEVWERIDINATKKTYLWWLLNFKNDVNYLKTVFAESFNPIPRVDSCLIEIQKNNSKNLDIDFNNFVDLLNLFSPYTRKTLGKIRNILEKNWKNIYIKDSIKQKRFENLSWENISSIIKNLM